MADGLIFRVTQKLAKKIKIAPDAALPPNENFLLDWTANLFMVSRWQCVLLTNSNSLYSVVLPGKGITNESSFIKLSMRALCDNMELDGIKNIFDLRIAPALKSVKFCKAGDRSVLASMNQLVYQVKYDLLYIRHPLPLVNHRLNRIPMSRLKYHYAVDELTVLANQTRT